MSSLVIICGNFVVPIAGLWFDFHMGCCMTIWVWLLMVESDIHLFTGLDIKLVVNSVFSGSIVLFGARGAHLSPTLDGSWNA